MKVFMFMLDGVKLVVAGCGTLYVVLSPLIWNPPAMQRMYDVLFGTKVQGFIHPAPTVWFFIRHFIGGDHAESVLKSYISLPFVFFAIAGLVFLPLFFSKPTNKLFLTCCVAFGMLQAQFGFIAHEKHIHYMYLALLMLPQTYSNFLTYTLAISSWCVFPLSTRLKSEYYALNYALLFVPVTFLVQQSLIIDDEKEPKGENKALTCIGPILEKFNHCSKFLLASIVSVMAFSYFLYNDAVEHFGYQGHEYDMLSNMQLKTAFVGLAIFNLYSWIVVFHTYLEPEDRQPIDKPIERPIDKPIEKPIDKPIDKPIEKPIDKSIEKTSEKPVEFAQ